MSQCDVKDANNRQNRFHCLSNRKNKHRGYAKEKTRRSNIEKFNGLVPELLDSIEIRGYNDCRGRFYIENDEQNDKLDTSNEKVKKCLEDTIGLAKKIRSASFDTRRYYHTIDSELLQELEDIIVIRQCDLAKKIRSASFDARHNKIAIDTINSELPEQNFKIVQQEKFEVIQEKHLQIAQELNFDIINAFQNENIDDKKALSIYKHKTLLRNKLPLGVHNFSLLDINSGDINKDLEILNQFNRDNLLKNFGIDLAKDENTKVTIKVEEFPAKNSINVQNKDNDFKEDKNNSSLDINSGDINKDLEILNQFNRDDLLKNSGIDLAKAENTKITTKAEEFPAKNSIRIQNEDNNVEENENHNASEQTVSKNNDVLFFDESVIKQIETQNNDSFVLDDFFDKDYGFKVNRVAEFNVLPKGVSSLKSVDQKNILWFLNVIKWLSGIFDCGLLVSLFILWQFFNPLFTAVSAIAFLVGLAIDTAIFVVAWRACSYLNNSVHELNNFSHIPENSSSQIAINNQKENKNQSLILNSDDKYNDLTQ